MFLFLEGARSCPGSKPQQMFCAVPLPALPTHLAPQQPSARSLWRAVLRGWLCLLLVVAGVVVLDDVILSAEEGDHRCRKTGDGGLLPTSCSVPALPTAPWLGNSQAQGTLGCWAPSPSVWAQTGLKLSGTWRGARPQLSEQLSGFLRASSKALKILVQCWQLLQLPALGFVLSHELAVGQPLCHSFTAHVQQRGTLEQCCELSPPDVLDPFTAQSIVTATHRLGPISPCWHWHSSLSKR